MVLALCNVHAYLLHESNPTTSKKASKRLGPLFSCCYCIDSTCTTCATRPPINDARFDIYLPRLSEYERPLSNAHVFIDTHAYTTSLRLSAEVVETLSKNRASILITPLQGEKQTDCACNVGTRSGLMNYPPSETLTYTTMTRLLFLPIPNSSRLVYKSRFD